MARARAGWLFYRRNLLAAVGLFGLWFLMSAAGSREKVYPKALGLPFLLFLMACVGSLMFTSAFSDSFRILLFFIAAFLLTFVIMADTTDERRLVSLMGWIYAAVILTALYAIAQRFMGVESKVRRGLSSRSPQSSKIAVSTCYPTVLCVFYPIIPRHFVYFNRNQFLQT